MQVVAATVPAPCAKLPPAQFGLTPQAPVPGPVWQVAQSCPSPCVTAVELVTKSNGDFVYVVLIQPVVDVGRSDAWHGRQVFGVALPGGWNFARAQDAPFIAAALV